MPSQGARLRPVTCRAALAVLALAAGCSYSNDITRAPPPKPPVQRSEVAAPATYASGRLPGTARPLHYALSLSIDPTKERFYGDVTIDIEVPVKTESLVLHGRELTIARSEVVLDGELLPARVVPRKAPGNKGSPEELVLSLSRPLPPGQAQIRIAYSAPLDSQPAGLYRVEEAGASYVFTQLQPTDARRLFPCFDEPSFKVPFDVKVTTPKGNLVVSNTPETDHTEPEDGRGSTFTFATTPPLPTYLLALGVGPFELREGPRGAVPLRVITPRGKADAGQMVLETAAAHLKVVAATLDQPFPFPKLDLLAVPELGFGAMESAGLVSFREDLVLLDATTASTSARRGMEEAVAHAMAHQWFGNLVTAAWWDDLWLHEGFAAWMKAEVLDTWRPATNARAAALEERSRAMNLDLLDATAPARPAVTSTSEAKEALAPFTGEKGGAVLAMLESWVGATPFRDGVRAYIKTHALGSATTDDLLTSLSSVSGQDAAAVASPFLDRAGVPLVRAELACEGGKPPRVTLSQIRLRATLPTSREPVKEGPFRIPVCIGYDGEGKMGPACQLLDKATGEVALPEGRCPRWIHPNPVGAGYYRFALPTAQLAALSANTQALDVRGRIGLIENTWALVQSGELGAEVLLELLSGLKRERHRLVVEAMIRALRGLSDTVVEEGFRPGFQGFASSLLLPIARELGWETRKTDTDDQRLLRRDTLEALLVLTEDPWLFTDAERKAAAFLKDPRAAGGSAAAIALRASTRRAGEARFRQLTTALKSASTLENRQTILEAMGSFADPALLRRALDWTLSGGVTTQDGAVVFRAATVWPAARPHVVAWLKEHLADLKGKLADTELVRTTEVLGTLCEEEPREEAARFFKEALLDVEGADRPLQQTLSAAAACVAMRQREAPLLTKRLSNWPRSARP
ncbi:M1 family metallopeptidase [Chondromyces crocatus]|uniref:Aminopeptidase n=1 Tax=Chondromyces crocatus TaxID=52 RepID=A0A0K1E7L8_CHOCO|nr:M1 family metallopeptidase [Chondromyces crocatus]AKT36881.1 peptidase M1 [Chondromyces crocatus]